MDIKEIIRNYFRIAPREADKIAVKADGQEYPVIDVGDRGVGIRLSDEDILLKVNDTLAIELELQGRRLDLQGKIVHISPDVSGQYLCGIEFQKITRQDQQMLLEYLQQH